MTTNKSPREFWIQESDFELQTTYTEPPDREDFRKFHVIEIMKHTHNKDKLKRVMTISLCPECSLYFKAEADWCYGCQFKANESLRAELTRLKDLFKVSETGLDKIIKRGAITGAVNVRDLKKIATETLAKIRGE